MGEFFKRVLAFVLGMIFGVISLVAGLVYVGVRFYKNTTLDDLGVTKNQVDLGDLNDSTIEELVSLVISASKNPESYTFADLEENYGVNVNGILGLIGIDVASLHPDDVTAIKGISPFTIAKENGFNELLDNTSLGVALAMIPSENGVYPVFSASARNKLRSYTIGDALKNDENGTMALMGILTELPMGSILSSMWTETYDENTDSYTYSSGKSALFDALGGLTISAFTNMGEDVGYALNEGELSKLGDIKLNELLEVEQGNAITYTLFNNTIANLFVKNGDSYTLDFMSTLNGIEVGTLMGMNKCDDNCTLEHSHVNGWYDENGNLVVDEDIASEIMLNLYGVTLEELTNGSFNVTNIVNDIYFGKALGYIVSEKDSYCDIDCSKDHSHEFYWVNGDGKFVGEMDNVISNVSLQECMEGGIDLTGMLGSIQLGELMGYGYCDGESCLITDETHVHKEGWYDKDGNLITNESISDEIMINLYGNTFEEFSNGKIDISKLSDGIYFGKALGYTVGEKVGYCANNCEEDHKHKFYWINSENDFVGELNNAIANIPLKDAMDGKADINSAINDVKLGYIMGNEYKDSNWYDKDGNLITNESISNEILLGLYDKTFEEFSNDGVDISSLSDGIYFGKALGYTVGEKVGYCAKDCEAEHEHEFYFIDKDEKFVGELNNAIANIPLKDAMDGKADINSAINDVKLGYIMGNEYKDDNWYDKDGNLITNDTIGNEMMLKLYEKTYKQLSNGEIDLANLSDGIYFGKALGYKMINKVGYCDVDCTEEHGHKFYWVDKDENSASELNNAIANILLKDAMDGKVNIDDTIKDVKLGSIMGKVYKDSNWYDKNGALINYETLDGGDKILYKLYNNKISDFTKGDFNVKDSIGDMFVGEVMGYKGSVGVWQKPKTSGGYEDTTAMENVVADILMKDMLEGKVDIKTKINALTLGDVIDVGDSVILKQLKDTKIQNLSTAIDELNVGAIMDYVKCSSDDNCPLKNVSGHVHDGGWYEKDGTKVTGLYSALAKYNIGELFNGTANIEELKIGEIIDTSGSPILKLLKDEPLNGLSDATNKLLLGEVMGYEKIDASGYCSVNCPTTHKHNYYWVKNDSQISGLNGKIANYTIKDVSDGKLGGNEFINTLTVGDVITTNTGMFNLMETEEFTLDDVTYEAVTSTNDVPVNEISARLTQGVKTATYKQLKDAGVAILSEANEGKVNTYYTEVKGVSNWQETKTIDQIISDIIETALTPLG